MSLCVMRGKERVGMMDGGLCFVHSVGRGGWSFCEKLFFFGGLSEVKFLYSWLLSRLFIFKNLVEVILCIFIVFS